VFIFNNFRAALRGSWIQLVRFASVAPGSDFSR